MLIVRIVINLMLLASIAHHFQLIISSYMFSGKMQWKTSQERMHLKSFTNLFVSGHFCKPLVTLLFLLPPAWVPRSSTNPKSNKRQCTFYVWQMC